MSVTLFKSLVLASIGIAIQLTLFFLKKGKSKRLEEIERQEEEERKRLLEEEWKAAQVLLEPEISIFRDLDEAGQVPTAGFSEFNKIHAYDGELNTMTFNCVKNSKAFKNIDISEDDSELMALFGTSSTRNTTLDGSKIEITDSDQ
jgi:hypothetical protein